MGQMDPYIYAVAEEAFQRLSRYIFLFFPLYRCAIFADSFTDSIIIVSGESGTVRPCFNRVFEVKK